MCFAIFETNLGYQFLGRPSKDIPYVCKARANLVNPLQGVHKKSHKDSVNMSQSIRKTTIDITKDLKQLPCPIDTCQKPVKRPDKHLRMVHKLQPRSPNLIQ